MSQVRASSRRDFIRSVAACATLPAVFGGDPYRPLTPPRSSPAGAIRIRGRVHALGKGIGRVAVSDGKAVVATDPSGAFQLVTSADRKYLTVSVPSGYALPTEPVGTARCFRRIEASPNGETMVDFGLERLGRPDDEHAFLLLSDIQTEDAQDFGQFRRDTVPDLKQTIAALGSTPIFGVADGDIAWDHLGMYDDYQAVVKELGVPFVQVVGNHDLDLTERTDAASTTTFERRFGPRYYSFNRGQVHYVVLDDVFYYAGGYLGYVDDDQLSWLAADLSLVEKGSAVVVFLHIPLYSAFFARQGRPRPDIANVVTNREAVYRLLEGFRATVLSGHLHESAYSTEGGAWERNHGTVCGAWWTGPICYDGTPAGYGIYRAKGAEVSFAYKATGKDLSHQMRLYRHGADPRAPDEIVANVWSWDPKWTVSWYEDGEKKGMMARRKGLDPLSVELHTGDQLPAKRPWIEPVQTDHLFYAPASRSAREVRVEATDGRGGVFSEVLRS